LSGEQKNASGVVPVQLAKKISSLKVIKVLPNHDCASLEKRKLNPKLPDACLASGPNRSSQQLAFLLP
jgi:hypothetical protein